MHVLSECKKVFQTECKTSHNKVEAVHSDNWYDHPTETVIETSLRYSNR